MPWAMMRSCAKTRFYLQQCGLRRLDGDGDGVPCERLCC
ncbi:excalibur calcium-binding domain-containing protein (plasmid) [Roseomonas marmotae]|uniref:Excalibur calcium-binding domain-containing protein n=1 Tax=Roseomonas marmotae TaxID=2768161 RepID=A0ABS3KIF5_9PROT|nr:excalibur calcium-binding domain-containing protein [Roseomonas marmotae]QTI82100.1 excalibur calcium-binding domain-containing protein [Roseomonas marmotae]